MSIYEITVSNDTCDSRGINTYNQIQNTFGFSNIKQVKTNKIYRLEGISRSQAIKIANDLLIDPIVEKYTINRKKDYDSYLAVEVAYIPGVMNPEVASILKASTDIGIKLIAADSSVEYLFIGQSISKEQVDQIIDRLLVNKTVETVVVNPPRTLITKAKKGIVETIPIRDLSNKELLLLSDGKLFLDIDEMLVIQKYFNMLGRDPTDIELEIIAARWSEHCGHKTFNAKLVINGVEKMPMFKRIKNAAKKHFGKLVLSAFNDNSGVISFYDGWAICGKVETHNSPSAIEPYGGAMTGSGGVFRDIMGTGQGAKTIISTDMFCFAPPDLASDKLPAGTLRPDYLQRRVVQGVRDYGNRMGIPTGNGSVHYHEDFRAKPTIIVGAYGVLPEKYAQQGKPQKGDYIIITGGKTGRDGIHGATFSSGEMTDKTAQINSNAVQIGNAIEEKRMSDALLVARDMGLIRAITDCGAAGFSSAIGELGEEIGIDVDIDKIPVKYTGMKPWEIWLSESQERMAMAIDPKKYNEFVKICNKYNVEVTKLGVFDGTNTLTIRQSGEPISQIDYDFLISGLPQRTMTGEWSQDILAEQLPRLPKNEDEWITRIKKVLTHGNVCSKEPIVRQYDHGVQGGNIVGPFGGVDESGPNDALVVRPILNKPYGVVQTHGMNPILNNIDPYEGTVWSITEAAANYVAVGGDITQAAGVGNYIWPFPDKQTMGSLDRAVDAAVDMMHILGVPVISGKDSLSSTYRSADGEIIKIPPVYTMSIFGKINDVSKTCTSDIKNPGLTDLYLIGNIGNGLAGSTYYDVLGASTNIFPKVDKQNIMAILTQIHGAISKDQILACHDISEGGLITTVSEMCFGRNCGAKIDLNVDDLQATMFAEYAGCFVVEISRETDVKKIFHDIPITEIGHTTKTPEMSVKNNSRKIFTVTTLELKDAWQSTMKGIF